MNISIKDELKNLDSLKKLKMFPERFEQNFLSKDADTEYIKQMYRSIKFAVQGRYSAAAVKEKIQELVDWFYICHPENQREIVHASISLIFFTGPLITRVRNRYNYYSYMASPYLNNLRDLLHECENISGLRFMVNRAIVESKNNTEVLVRIADKAGYWW